MKKYYYLLFFLAYFSLSQSKIGIEFTQSLIKEEFDTVSLKWPIVLSEKMFISPDKGEYFLNNNKNSEYAVISNWENDLLSYKVETTFKLAPREIEKPYLGIVTNSKDDGSEAIIFDFDGAKRYRIRYYNNGKIKIITKKNSKDGWKKSDYLNRYEEFNNIKIKTDGKVYELYINNQLEFSFDMNYVIKKDISIGKFGFIVGPNTRSRVDYFNVYSSQDYNGINKTINLKKGDLDKILNENSIMSNRIDSLLMENQKILQLESAISILEDELKITSTLKDSLMSENLKFEELQNLMGNIDDNLLISMTKELRSQLEITQVLKQDKKELQDSINYLIQSNELFKLELLNSVIEKENNKKDMNEKLPTDSIVKKDMNEPIIENLNDQLIEKKENDE